MLLPRTVRTLAAVLLAALVGALLTAAPARAAERTVAGGRLDWGIKSSFQRYVTGPVAQGSWSLNGGAATVGRSQFRFHSAQGGYDPGSGALRAGFSGGVHFLGHRQADGSYQLDLTISRPTVRIAGGRGTLYADVRSKSRSTGQFTAASQVPLATLNLSGLNMRGGSSPIVLTNIPATLTTQGATAFAGYYAAGAALDPVSLSADVKAASSAASPSPEPTGGTGDSTKDRTEKDGTEKPGAATAGKIADAAVDWGVRRTFREYVTGSIAQGSWTLSQGARDGGALFRFPAGTGTYDLKKQTLKAFFTGTLRFTGKDLDLTLNKVSVTVEDGTGTLAAAVNGGGSVSLATFDAPSLKAESGLILISEAPTELTAEGAAAFDGLYRAGTEMDPVTLAVAVEDSAELPPLPDLGTDPTPAESADESPATAPAETPRTEAPRTGAAGSSSDDFPALPVSLAGAALLAAAATAVFRTLRRRRVTTAPTGATPSDNAENSHNTEER